MFLAFFGMITLLFSILGIEIPKNKAIIKILCIGENKFYTEYGFRATPYCVTKFSDGNKACNRSKDCRSKMCVMEWNEIEQLKKEIYGIDASKKISYPEMLLMTIPKNSGHCTENNIDLCFSVPNGVVIEDGKIVYGIVQCD